VDNEVENLLALAEMLPSFMVQNWVFELCRFLKVGRLNILAKKVF
jgi:hypothetical protein